MFKRKTPFTFPIKLSIPPWAIIISSFILSLAYIGASYFHLPSEVPHPQTLQVEGEIQACFTPNKMCQTRIIETIMTAKKSIHLQAYSFTDPEIGQALKEAALRNVDVLIILDKSNRKDPRSLAKTYKHPKISFRYDHLPGIAHNKIIILDEEILITGSYNFSKSAYSRNAENVLFIKNTKLIQDYLKNWHVRWDKSKP